MFYKSQNCKGISGSTSVRGRSLAGIKKKIVKGISGKIGATPGVLKMEVVYAVHFLFSLTMFWEDCGLQTH